MQCLVCMPGRFEEPARVIDGPGLMLPAPGRAPVGEIDGVCRIPDDDLVSPMVSVLPHDRQVLAMKSAKRQYPEVWSSTPSTTQTRLPVRPPRMGGLRGQPRQ